MNVKSNYYNKNDTFFRPANLEKIKRLYDFDKSKRLKILDIGCGDGKIGSQFIKKGHEVFGLDISTSACNQAKEFGIKALIHDVETTFPFEDDYFDMVIATDILEHVFDPLYIVNEARRVLKNEGKFIAAIPNHFDLRNRMNILQGGGIVHWDNKKLASANDYGHIRFLRYKDISQMINKADMHIHKNQFNFMGGGLIPTKIIPKFVRLFLLKKLPNLFTGKFIFLAKKNKPEKIKNILISNTPLGL